MIGGTYTRQQRAIQQALRQHRRVVVPSGHGTGKSFSVGDLALWFMKSFKSKSTKVVTTAPTARQVRDIVWRSMRSRIKTSRVFLGGKLLPKAAHWEFDDEYFAEGFATDEQEKMQGYHAKYLLIILDEAAGVPELIWDAASRLATGTMNFILAIGNPGAPHGPFYDAAVNNPDWHTLQLSSEDHPNVQSGVEIVPGAATRVFCDEMATRYGSRSSPLYKAYVRGLFPSESVDTVITPRNVEDAYALELPRNSKEPIVISCDLARFGDDQTVIMTFEGLRQIGVRRFSKRPVDFTCRQIMHRVSKFESRGRQVTVIVDADGIGGALLDFLRERGVNARGFYGSLAPWYAPSKRVDRRTETYTNMRTQAWFEAADLFRQGIVSLKGAQGKILKTQLSSLTYRFVGDGRLQLERKEELKKRLPSIGSPDQADAVVMGLWGVTHAHLDVPEPDEKERKTWREEMGEYLTGNPWSY